MRAQAYIEYAIIVAIVCAVLLAFYRKWSGKNTVVSKFKEIGAKVENQLPLDEKSEE